MDKEIHDALLRDQENPEIEENRRLREEVHKWVWCLLLAACTFCCLFVGPLARCSLFAVKTSPPHEQKAKLTC